MINNAAVGLAIAEHKNLGDNALVSNAAAWAMATHCGRNDLHASCVYQHLDQVWQTCTLVPFCPTEIGTIG